jgi:hypothetical protein
MTAIGAEVTMRIHLDRRPFLRSGPPMRIGTGRTEIENARRSVALAPEESPVTVTCGELKRVLARLQDAENEADDLRRHLRSLVPARQPA